MAIEFRRTSEVDAGEFCKRTNEVRHMNENRDMETYRRPRANFLPISISRRATLQGRGREGSEALPRCLAPKSSCVADVFKELSADGEFGGEIVLCP